MNDIIIIIIIGSKPAKGIHITIPHRLVQNSIAIVVPVPGDRRSVFVVPQGEFAYIGTTDTEWKLDRDHPAASHSDRMRSQVSCSSSSNCRSENARSRSSSSALG